MAKSREMFIRNILKVWKCQFVFEYVGQEYPGQVNSIQHPTLEYNYVFEVIAQTGFSSDEAKRSGFPEA